MHRVPVSIVQHLLWPYLALVPDVQASSAQIKIGIRIKYICFICKSLNTFVVLMSPVDIGEPEAQVQMRMGLHKLHDLQGVHICL